MPTDKKVQDTHISPELKSLHLSMVGIASVMNRPRNDARLLEEAGVTLDQALFRLLVVIERFGPIGVVDLAERLGRDYTTISRQVAKLAAMELVERRGNAQDRRLREATVTPKGKDMTDRLDAARERIGRRIFASWAPQDVTDLVRLMAKFAAALEAGERTP
ncbi:MarR family winged helix-turn-helix transcriptional regulator [Xanthomonas sacchari]|uniref:MarR family winged helix-turn-helix transcriptional regulator n=1 Tax=Xanthomonas sacchari TaxID=56458 RepID=UPI0020C32A71|nr:MarR family winged helix-turn-helix transcriptional regulator [Xanthomonas sacchari]